MQALGRDLAGELTNGGVIGLDGELGEGKTELVKGLASGVSHGGPGTSPTFTLLHEYRMGSGPFTTLIFTEWREQRKFSTSAGMISWRNPGVFWRWSGRAVSPSSFRRRRCG